MSINLLQRAQRIAAITVASSSAMRCRDMCHVRLMSTISPSSTSSSKSNNTIAAIERGVDKIRIYDEIDLLAAHLDWHYLLDAANRHHIEQNIQRRKGNGDIASLVTNLNQIPSIFVIYELSSTH